MDDWVRNMALIACIGWLADTHIAALLQRFTAYIDARCAMIARD